jgi:hypothetical protein
MERGAFLKAHILASVLLFFLANFSIKIIAVIINRRRTGSTSKFPHLRAVAIDQQGSLLFVRHFPETAGLGFFPVNLQPVQRRVKRKKLGGDCDFLFSRVSLSVVKPRKQSSPVRHTP